MENMKVSVVTVCYNAENAIRATIESVLSQTYEKFEYIIIDGKSSDMTLEIINEYREAFEKRNLSFLIISEEDTGIYNAMNKAIRFCRGNWIHYLNAGDLFVDENVLTDVFTGDKEISNDVAVIYGDYYKRHPDKMVLCKTEPLTELERKMCFCHQAAFTRKSIAEKNRFDESYKIAADHKFFLQLQSKELNFVYIPIPIAIFDCSGISQQNEIQLIKEEFRLKNECGIIFQKNKNKEWMRKNYLIMRKRMQNMKKRIRLWMDRI